MGPEGPEGPPGAAGGVVVFEQPGDPGTVDEGTLWIDTDAAPPTTPLPILKSCRVRRAARQSIPNLTVPYVSWDTEDFDPYGMFNPADPTKVTIPEAGWWLISSYLQWVAASTAGVRYCAILANGVMVAGTRQPLSSADGTCEQTLTRPWLCAAGEVIVLQVYQAAGIAIELETQTNLHVVQLGRHA